MQYNTQQLTEIRKQIYNKYIYCAKIKLTPQLPGEGLLDYQDMYAIHLGVYQDSKLQLLPLSSITDEDVEAVDELEIWNAVKTGKLNEAKNMVLNACLFYRGFQKIASYQYLQLKGYALPQLVILDGKLVMLSVEEQIELGIIELTK